MWTSTEKLVLNSRLHSEVTGVLQTYQGTLPVTTSCHMAHGINFILPSESFRLWLCQWIAKEPLICGEIQIQKTSVKKLTMIKAAIAHHVFYENKTFLHEGIQILNGIYYCKMWCRKLMRNIRSCQHSTQYLTVVQILPTFPPLWCFYVV